MKTAGSPFRDSPIRHVVLITIDAVGEGDRPVLETLPAYARFMREGAYSYAVRSVWPSLTYVAHATMQTGRSPRAHGIRHNCVFQPEASEGKKSWYWYRKQIRVPTFFDLAASAGHSTATVSFPVTGKSRVTWSFPEIAGIAGLGMIAKLAATGTLPYLLDLNVRFGKMLKGSREPELDDFITACAARAIGTKRPGLTAIHLLDADKTKHRCGIHTEETKRALAHSGSCVERIMRAVEDAGMADSTAFILAGDHSQFQLSRNLRLNALLREAGLVRKSPKGLDWSAWIEGAGGSAILHARGPAAEAQALKILRKAAARPEYGISRIVDRLQLRRFGADESVSWAVDGRPGTFFDDALDGPVLSGFPDSRGAHGYLPDWPGYRTVFFAAGPGISRGRDLGRMDMRDIAPVVGSLLGFTVPQAEGRVPAGLFLKERGGARL